MGRFVDITGNRYGRLVVIRKAESRQVGNRKRIFWECECDCGNKVSVCGEHLKDGHTQSCGCKVTDFSGEDLTGKKYGRLTVLRFKEIKKTGVGKRYLWECQCECGKKSIVAGDVLKNGNTRSCGCLAVETRGKASITHGKRHTALYGLWCSMKGRCGNPNNKSYKFYGARGISVCSEWENNFQSFYDWAMANGYKAGLQLDRIDTNGNYCPENCRFITQKENENNRRDNVIVDYQGTRCTLSQFAEQNELDYDRLRYLYVQCGLSIDEIFEKDYMNKQYKREKGKVYRYKGETHTLKELAEIYNVDIVTLKSRVHGMKWDIARAIEEPKHEYCINDRYKHNT